MGQKEPALPLACMSHPQALSTLSGSKLVSCLNGQLGTSQLPTVPALCWLSGVNGMLSGKCMVHRGAFNSSALLLFFPSARLSSSFSVPRHGCIYSPLVVPSMLLLCLST